MTEEHYVGGKIVSTDPIVTYSKRGAGWPTGIACARPHVFRDRRALHLIALSFSIEAEGQWRAVAREIEQISQALPENRFVVITNTEFEAYLLSTLGVASMPASQLIFVDESVFRPLDCPASYDAIYNGRLALFKRHALARMVGNLALLYDIGPPSEPPLREETRALLPHAIFINHERGEGVYRKLTNEECVGELNRARVGLCLSAIEGSMRAAMEYLLCGLPVVSTRSIGGRERYFMPPFCRIVDDDPAAVRDAVDALLRARIPKQAVRGHTLHMLSADRHSFLLAVNRLVAECFGIADHFKSFAPFATDLTTWRTPDEVIAPLHGART